MNIAFWLGVPGIIKTQFDIIKLGHHGLPIKAFDNLAMNMGVTRKALAEDIFDLSVKTLERKSPDDLLDKRTSSHALEIAKIMDHALDVFEDEEKVKRWISKPNRALNNTAPVKLFDTLTGINMVNAILTRIEEGVYS